jgi:outer membrane lipoprotein-sorting protein
MAVILLGLALIAFSVALIIQFQADTAIVGNYFSRYQSIESFNIDFQRIIAILRDQYSGVAALYPSFNASEAII